jgi:hypothetical protein
MSALEKIEKAGFKVFLSGDDLGITHANNLTMQQREFLKSHKAEIVAELKAVIVLCYSPSGLAYEVEASSYDHADFLRRMNPPPANKRNINP